DLFIEVPLHTLLSSRHRRRLEVSERDRETFRRREDPGLRCQRGGFAVQRLRLAKVRDVPGISPFIGLDAAIDVDGEGRSRQQEEQCPNAGYVSFAVTRPSSVPSHVLLRGRAHVASVSPYRRGWESQSCRFDA